MYVERVFEAADGNRFEIRVKGNPRAPSLFICEREHITVKGKAQRGNWLMLMYTMLGWLEVDRDQYSNDLLERANIHFETGAYYGGKFKIECSHSAYLLNVENWKADLALQFGGYGGEFAADYHDWESKAVLTKKVA